MPKNERNWEQHYQDNHTPWDKTAPSPALLEILNSGELPSGSAVLVPGCGYGHDAAVLAESGCPTTGTDISPTAITTAREMYTVDGLNFTVDDILEAPVESAGSYNVIWEHTCFCAIMPDQRDDYVTGAYQRLKPGSCLLGVFFAFADAPDTDGPPFKTTSEIIRSHFETRFSLQWQRRPKQSYSSRVGQELLMCWRRD